MVLLKALSTIMLVIATMLGLSEAVCTHPSVRKEWRKLSKVERADWINAVKCLAKLPHDDALTPYVKPDDIVPVNKSGSYYDDFVYMHMDMNHLIHSTGLFLPWHRWYVAVYESALKSKCGFTGASPYWGWTQDAPNVYGSSIFDPDPVSGLGGWGNKSDDIHVENGAFGKWSSFRLSYPVPHPLRRNFTIHPYPTGSPFYPNPDLDANATFTAAEVNKMVNGFAGDFKGFQTYFEGFQGAHAAVHLITGGDLGGQCPVGAPADCQPAPTFSPNEPLFWLHHAMVDKVWFDWQKKNPRNAKAYFGGSVQRIGNFSDYEMYPTGGPPFLTTNYSMPAVGMFPEATIRDVLSTTGGTLCYVYE